MMPWQGRRRGATISPPPDEAGAWHLLVLDTRQGLWYREDGVEALGFAPWGGDLYCLTAEGQAAGHEGRGETHEGPVQWWAETGELGLDAAGKPVPGGGCRCRFAGGRQHRPGLAQL